MVRKTKTEKQTKSNPEERNQDHHTMIRNYGTLPFNTRMKMPKIVLGPSFLQIVHLFKIYLYNLVFHIMNPLCEPLYLSEKAYRTQGSIFVFVHLRTWYSLNRFPRQIVLVILRRLICITNNSTIKFRFHQTRSI